MELLQFVFSSFWVWLGCVVLIVAAGEAVATAAAGFRQKRKVSVYHVGDVTRVEVENAGRAAGRFVHRRKGGVPDGGGHHALCH